MKASLVRARSRVDQILKAFERSILTVKVELDHHTFWELLVATILSA